MAVPAGAQRPAAGYPAGVPGETPIWYLALCKQVLRRRKEKCVRNGTLTCIKLIKLTSERYRGHYSPLLFDRQELLLRKLIYSRAYEFNAGRALELRPWFPAIFPLFFELYWK